MSDVPGNSARARRQLLADWQSAGVLFVPRPQAPVSAEETAVELQAEPMGTDAVTERELVPTVTPAESLVDRPVDAESFQVPQSESEVAASSLSRDEREQQLATLAETVSQCTRCSELAQARTQTVFGVGNPEASVMFVGEAPGADEDAQGEPFVGRAGQLLNKIIGACGWQREEIYICNILRCRPPGNRNPSTEEAANCREYLDGQIRLVDPDYIVCWGSVAAHNLLDETTAIGKLRQKWFKHGRAKVLCTYHPSYLLRNPAAKKPVWEDMKLLLAEMGLEPPQ